MTRTSLIRLSTAGVALLMIFTAPDVWAQDDGEEEEQQAALKSGKSVRRKLLYRSTRFELSPGIGVTSGDTYLRNAVAGLNASYYLTNAIGLGLVGGYSPLHPETSLANNVKESLDQNAPSTLEELTFSYLQWFAGFELKYVPIFGKFSFMNDASLSYDMHLVAGASLMGVEACSASDPDTACAANGASDAMDESLSEIRPAGTIGLGFRVFFSDAYALNLQVRDHLYQRAQVSTGDAEADFSSNVYLSLGFSMFFPQTVKISR